MNYLSSQKKGSDTLIQKFKQTTKMATHNNATTTIAAVEAAADGSVTDAQAIVVMLALLLVVCVVQAGALVFLCTRSVMVRRARQPSRSRITAGSSYAAAPQHSIVSAVPQAAEAPASAAAAAGDELLELDL